MPDLKRMSQEALIKEVERLQSWQRRAAVLLKNASMTPSEAKKITGDARWTLKRYDLVKEYKDSVSSGPRS